MRLRRRLWPAQVCRRRSLLYLGQLRGAVPSLIRYSRRLPVPQRTKVNKQAIESLAPRVKALAERLCQPVPEGDIKERQRRKILER